MHTRVRAALGRTVLKPSDILFLLKSCTLQTHFLLFSNCIWLSPCVILLLLFLYCIWLTHFEILLLQFFIACSSHLMIFFFCCFSCTLPAPCRTLFLLHLHCMWLAPCGILLLLFIFSHVTPTLKNPLLSFLHCMKLAPYRFPSTTIFANLVKLEKVWL